MTELKIEKNIPFPTRTDRGGRNKLLANMEIGDSIHFPEAKTTPGIYSEGKLLGFKLSIRKVTEGGYRVWRTA